MAAQETYVEQVYSYLWEYVKTNEALPSFQMICAATGLSRYEVSACIDSLRKADRIAPRVLLPTAYCAWWREHVRAHWSYEAMRRS